MTIVWFSRHAPTLRQETKLKSLFGPYTLIQDRREFNNARTVLKRFHDHKADELIVVAPLSIIRHIVKAGVKPLWAQMEPASPTDPDAEVIYTSRHRRYYRFVKFWRVRALKLELEEIAPYVPSTVDLQATAITTIPTVPSLGMGMAA